VAGMMRSFDQYGNVMLEDTFERHVVGNVYADERVFPSTSAPSSNALNLHLMSAILTHVLAPFSVSPAHRTSMHRLLRGVMRYTRLDT
jgi:hypothetical protein